MIYTYGINSNRTTSIAVLKKYMLKNFLDEGVILDVCPGLRRAIEKHYKTPIHRYRCNEFGFFLDKGLVYVPSCMVSRGRQGNFQRIVLLKDTLFVYNPEEESISDFI